MCASVCSGGGQSDCVSPCMSVWTLCGGDCGSFLDPKWAGEGGGLMAGWERRGEEV